MTKNMKVLTWVFGIIVLLIGLIIFAYFYFFVGITPKTKYEKCCHTCEEIMLNESNIPSCKLECERVANYSPSSSSTQSTQTAEKSPETTTKSETSTSNLEDINYYCEWSWPQRIIDQDTKEVIQTCNYSKPYCFYDDKTYDTVSCCSDAEHTDCTLLSDMD